MDRLKEFNKTLPLNMEIRALIELQSYRDFNFFNERDLADCYINKNGADHFVTGFINDYNATMREAQIKQARINDIKEFLIGYCGYSERALNLCFNYGISDQIKVIKPISYFVEV